MDFPKASIDKARRVVAEYRKRGRSKRDLAVYIYNNSFIELGYGFSEEVKRGNCGLYFHEIDRECDCFTYLGVAYLVAREAGLKPEMWESRGIKDVAEGQDPTYKNLVDHGFVTVQVRRGKRAIIDKQMGLWGEVTFHPDQHTIGVYNAQNKSETSRHYAYLKRVGLDTYLKRLKSNRTLRGGKKVLETTQRITGAGGRQVFLGYYPETQEVKSSLRFSLALMGPEEYSRIKVVDLKTAVREDGDYNFRDGEFSFYNVSVTRWREHPNPQVPFIIKVRDAEKVWAIWEAVARRAGRRSPLNRIFYLKLESILREAGFGDNFTLREDSLAACTAKEEGLSDLLGEFKEAEISAIDSYLQRLEGDELSKRLFLRRARYILESDKSKTPSNPNGLVFPLEDHEALLRAELKKYFTSTERLIQELNRAAEVRAKFKSGSLYTLGRGINRTLNRESESAVYFDTMCSERNYRFPQLYNIGADWELFKRQWDVKQLSLDELGNGLSVQDLKRAAQLNLFEQLVNALTLREALFLASYKSGLRKILDRRGD